MGFPGMRRGEGGGAMTLPEGSQQAPQAPGGSRPPPAPNPTAA